MNNGDACGMLRLHFEQWAGTSHHISACNSYDCDFIDALLSVSLFCASVGRGTNTTYHNGAGAFYIDIGSPFPYYATNLGACLMIAIIFHQIRFQPF